MMDVTVPLDGKNAACDDPEVVSILVGLLSQCNEHVRAFGAGALMTIAITTKGKKVCLDPFLFFGSITDAIAEFRTEVWCCEQF